jgi:hypothetical protein
MAWVAEFTVVSTHTGCGIHPSLYLVGNSCHYCWIGREREAEHLRATLIGALSMSDLRINHGDSCKLLLFKIPESLLFSLQNARLLALCIYRAFHVIFLFRPTDAHYINSKVYRKVLLRV